MTSPLLKSCNALCDAADTLCEVCEAVDVKPTNATLTEWADAVRRGALLARVAQALRDHNGNRTRAAQALGVTSSYLGRVAMESAELVREYPARCGNPHDAGDEKAPKTRRRKKK